MGLTVTLKLDQGVEIQGVGVIRVRRCPYGGNAVKLHMEIDRSRRIRRIPRDRGEHDKR